MQNKVEELKMQREWSANPGENLPSNSRVGEKAVSSMGSVGTSTRLLTSLGVVRGCLQIPLMTPSNVILKSRTASHFTSNMGLFGNSRKL